MDTFVKDVRYAVRNLLQARGFATVAVLTLALGIGATTAMFSVVNSVLLRPLPYFEPERLVSLNEFSTTRPRPEIPEGTLSYPDYADIAKRNRSFESVAAYTYGDFTLTGLGEALHLQGENVSPALFHVLGAQPELGRSFLPEEDAASHHVAIISDRFWRAHFNADPSVIGRIFGLSGHSYSIVGVMKPGFQFAIHSHPVDLWMTFSQWAEVDDPRDKPATEQRGNHSIFTIARLKPGVSVEQASSDMESLARQLSVEFPDSNIDRSIAVTPELVYAVGSTRTPLLILLGAVGLVLLIACANVANLLLARGSGRAREIAIRGALGASRARVIRQLVTESLVLATLGGALGAGFASWGLGIALKLYPENLPRAAEIGVDHRVLFFTAALTIATGVLFGLVPAWRLSAPNLSETMREGGRTATSGPAHNRLRSTLAVAQTALGVMLLIGAGLLIRSFERLSHADLGLNPDHLLTANFDLSEIRYKPDQIDTFITELISRLRSMPGVVDAGGITPLPLGGDDGWRVSFTRVDHPLPEGRRPSGGFYVVTNSFFQTMQIPLVSGRFFEDRDSRNSAPVMIVTASFAKKYFPGENPIGHQIEIGAGEGEARKRYKTREVIGVVGDIRSSNLAEEPVAAYYIPLAQLMWGPPTLVLRTAGDPNSIAPSVAKVISSMDADAPLYNVRTMEDCLALDLGRARFQTVLLSLFAGIALLLTAIGLYGVIAYSVVQRTHEIGVRMALGASRLSVLSMMLNRGLQLTVIGLAIGVAGALALARVIEALLYEIPPRDPATYFLVCIALAPVALLASYLPAARATKVDPMVALRCE